MRVYSEKEIRNTFIHFFQKKNHQVVASSSLVPQGDKTILFTNSGMNQFKDIFLGLKKAEFPRVCNYQKCIRLSGKHNDLEEVGYDSYHHTFFEMLGNWSFGDYSKKEAIIWAWEILTDVWSLPKKKLFATVYFKDLEAKKLWAEVTDIDIQNILSFDEKDNFWEMAEVGPCGPCSEVHVDLGEENCSCVDVEKKKKCRRLGGGINQDCARYIEIWNLVFIQYNRNAQGELVPLDKVYVDTGMGFERICRILQKKKSNYATDVFNPIIEKIEKITHLKYHDDNQKQNIAFRVIADHIRTITFAIVDGIMPSNNGRGYVIRRVLRRAFRYGRVLEFKQPFLGELVEVVKEEMGEYYPEIIRKFDLIKKTILSEEKLFLKALDKGLALFEKLAKQLKKNNQKKISGKQSFELYDTYGFPWDLITLLARERKLVVLEDEFNRELKKQKERSRLVSKGLVDITLLQGLEATTYLGENETKIFGVLIKIIFHQQSLETFDQQGKLVYLVFNETCFYAESGGQIGDGGKIYDQNQTVLVEVKTVKKIEDIFLIEGELKKGQLRVNRSYWNEIDLVARNEIRKNHTATHLMHQALINHLGEHVRQAGSIITPDKLRFDFNHYQPLSEDEINKITQEVNQKIIAALPIGVETKAYNQATKEGARAFFEEKYKEEVRVVRIRDYSLELCGGSHVNHTTEIGSFQIISETGVASGIRRIEALTGKQANLDYQGKVKTLKVLSKIVSVNEPNKLIEKVSFLNHEITRLKSIHFEYLQKNYLVKIKKEKVTLNNFNLYFFVFKKEENDLIKSIVDKIKQEDKKSIIFFLKSNYQKLIYFIALGIEAVACYSAHSLLNLINKLLGGHGGGKVAFAQGGAPPVQSPKKIEEILTEVKCFINKNNG